MKAVSTMMRSKFEIVRVIECNDCGLPISVIKTVIEEKETEIDKCLNCENKRLQSECQTLYEQRKMMKVAKIFERFSFVTDDLKQANFEKYLPDHETQIDAKKKSVWFAEHFGMDNFKENNWKSLLFQGDYGLGKSHLSYCIAKRIRDRGYSVIFINVPDLLNAIKDTFNNKSNITEADILTAAKDVDLLILDDLGAEYVKQDKDGKESWAVDKLFTIINSRIGKSNIYTTNYSSKDLGSKYGMHGGRIISKMMQGTKVIKMQGEDYRMKGW